jgi:hypothetical protein
MLYLAIAHILDLFLSFRILSDADLITLSRAVSCRVLNLFSSHLISSLTSRLYSSAFYDQHMIPFQPPEIATTSLEDLLLQVCLTDMTHLAHTTPLLYLLHCSPHILIIFREASVG